MNDDQQRINWLEEVNGELPVTVEKTAAGEWVVSIGRRVSYQAASLREAIDAAMEALA